VEEISGVAFIFNQKFFQDLKEETGETHLPLFKPALSCDFSGAHGGMLAYLGTWDWVLILRTWRQSFLLRTLAGQGSLRERSGCYAWK
jgi:hypothetical protein